MKVNIMQSINYDVKHHYQPTNNTCGYTAHAILLSYYDREFSPEELVKRVPQPQDSEGTSHGSVTAQLVEWCQTQGLQTHMYASDLWILDLAWQDKKPEEIKEKLEAVRSTRKVPAMGIYWTTVYVDSYTAMINSGAKLTIKPFITTKLLYKLLDNGPVFANICSTASSGSGRTVNPGLREKKADDMKGTVSTHSVVIHGNDSSGNFLVADPWDGMVTFEPEHMVLAITAAQIECDNQVFVIEGYS